MIKNLSITTLLFIVAQWFAFAGNITIDPTYSFLDADDIDISPGDTVFLEAGLYQHLKFKHFRGDSTNPIIFTNSNGIVEINNTDFYYNLSFDDCRYIHLTGTGDSNSYFGIQINQGNENAIALSFALGSSDIEIDHIQITNTESVGIMIKSDPECNQFQRDDFTLKNVSIHDNYFENIGKEAIYIGYYLFSEVTLSCQGEDTKVFAHTLENVSVYNNEIKNIGWDGIQVACTPVNCQIYNNDISNYGTELNLIQSSGIQVGAGTSGDIYNNHIHSGHGTGIQYNGSGNSKIYNNIINYNTSDHLGNDNRYYGIFIDDRFTIPNSYIHIINNTIINAKSDAIRIYSKETRNNLIVNNAIVNPGSFEEYENDDTQFTGDDSYFFITGDKSRFIKANNFLTLDITEAKFTDPASENFHPRTSSPLVNKGLSIDTLDIEIDFMKNERTQGNNIDIGAAENISQYEFFNTHHQGDNQDETLHFYPHPLQGDELNIIFTKDDISNLKLTDGIGNVILEISGTYSSEESVQVPIGDLPQGFYFISFDQANKKQRRPLFISQ